MKAASIDGPFGLLAACAIFNIEMLYCEFVFFWQIKCLLLLSAILVTAADTSNSPVTADMVLYRPTSCKFSCELC